MKKMLVTGGAGFVGSNLLIGLRERLDGAELTAFDNLYRRGSEMNLPRLEKAGIHFVKGDVRSREDLESLGEFDCLIECSAEPSVLAGKNGGHEYLVETNLQGALNCAEICRKNGAVLIFVSTSRVYPIRPLLDSAILESEKRFDFSDLQSLPGLGGEGVSEKFEMGGARSLYGATKYAAEVMLTDYAEAFGFPLVLNRCGVIAGPWQFGKVDQGIAVHWLASHILGKELKYIGFGGKGKQVRDFLHVDDLLELILLQIENPAKFANIGAFNVGGGRKNSASLLELTELCAEISGRKLEIGSDPVTRYADIPVYVGDSTRIRSLCSWKPGRNLEQIFSGIYEWLNSSPEMLRIFR